MAKKDIVVVESSSGWQIHRCFVTPGERVELHTFDSRTKELKGVIVFNIGDHAEYDSYNLKYCGPIKQITAKGVTIQKRYSETCTRLPWDRFSWRNWDYDAEKIANENAETMQYI